MPPTALSTEQIESRLDEALDPVLSSRRTAAALARALAELERAQQDFALHWVDIIVKTNAEMAYQFAARNYLPHMYGAVNWTLEDDVRVLPLKVSDIYRRLTL